MSVNGDRPAARQRVALIELTPATVQRLRDPRIVLALVAALTGGVALFAGYLGVSGTLDPGRQLPYLISGGIGGLFLLGLAASLLFSSDVAAVRDDVRDLGDRLDRLAGEVSALAALLDADVRASAEGGANGATPEPRRPPPRAPRRGRTPA